MEHGFQASWHCSQKHYLDPHIQRIFKDFIGNTLQHCLAASAKSRDDRADAEIWVTKSRGYVVGDTRSSDSCSCTADELWVTSRSNVVSPHSLWHLVGGWDCRQSCGFKWKCKPFSQNRKATASKLEVFAFLSFFKLWTPICVCLFFKDHCEDKQNWNWKT